VLLHQSLTSIPIDLAAPATIAIADSIDSVLRSGSLISAIFLICALVTEPTLTRFGVPEPFSTPASFFSRTAAGGVLVMKEKDRILALRPSVELFAEGHDVDSLRAECRSHGGRRIRLACRDLQLDETNCLLCHDTPQ